MENGDRKKVIIIGAGPAGLAAGYKLLKEGKNAYEVIILEASNEIGGISKTIKYNGNRIDIGGHRFFTKSEEVQKFWNEIMPKQGKPAYDDKILQNDKKYEDGGPDPEKTDNVMLIRNRVSRIYYLKKFFDYPISLKFQTFKNMGLKNTIVSGFSYLKSLIIKKKEDSLENFYENRFGKKLYNMFFEKYTEKLWGRHPSEIDASWGAQRVKGVSVKAVIVDALKKVFHIKSKKVETSLIEQFSYPKYGPGQFYERVAEEFEKIGGKIYRGYAVCKINYDKNKIKSVECANGEIVSGDFLLSSMPIKDLIEAMDSKELDSDIKRIAVNLPYRDFITVGVLLKKINLKNQTQIKTINNIIPDNWVYVQDPDVRMCRFQVFNNWSPYMVKDVDKYIWIGLEYVCSENDDLWNKDDENFKNFAIDELVKMNIITKDDVLDSCIARVKKAYPAYFDTYNEIDKVINYLNGYDNLFCIGRNGQHRYNNMDHSILTGFVAVDKIINNDKDKTSLWNINTEKEYHEAKQ